MAEQNGNSRKGQKMKQGLDRKILRSTAINVLVLVIICCIIMAFSMQALASNILLDSLQPMARQSAKTVEANIHMLADRMMTIAKDSRMRGEAEAGEESRLTAAAIRENRRAMLEEAAEIYEFFTIALYDTNGRLVQGIESSPDGLDSDFFALLKETDNLTTFSSTVVGEKLGIMMGMPVKENGETSLYLVGIYKYDMLNDVIGSIHLGRHGMAYMVNREGIVVGHQDQSVIFRKSTLSQLNESGAETMSRITTGETGAMELPVGGEKILTAFSPIRGTQWSLVVQIPKSDYRDLIGRALWIAVLATVGGLTISLLLALRLSRSISRPVKNVTQRMVALSAGDLHTEIVPIHTQDELEIMTQTLEETVESVNRYISDIQQVLTQVAGGNLRTAPRMDYKGDFVLIRGSLHTILQSMNETLLGFRGAAVRLAEMAEELSGQSGELHRASLDQNRSTEALVHEVACVKERLSNVTESSSRTRAQTEEITQRIQTANSQMEKLSSAMDNIRFNAQEITKIAKDIENIAFQTNLLALNASVEAAHAGAAGQGFAVVAEQVRRLAAQSAQAAQSASNIVKNTRNTIQTGVELTADTAGSLRAISDFSEQISEISDQLVVAVEGQESALAIMEDRIEEISGIADRNLQSAEGTEKSSGLLAKEAEALRHRVAKFVLKEEGEV